MPIGPTKARARSGRKPLRTPVGPDNARRPKDSQHSVATLCLKSRPTGLPRSPPTTSRRRVPCSSRSTWERLAPLTASHLRGDRRDHVRGRRLDSGRPRLRRQGGDFLRKAPRQAHGPCVHPCALDPLPAVLRQHPALRVAARRWHGADRQRRIRGWCAGGGRLRDSRLRALRAGGCADSAKTLATTQTLNVLDNTDFIPVAAGVGVLVLAAGLSSSAARRLAEVAGLGRRRDRRPGVHAGRASSRFWHRDLGRDRQHRADDGAASLQRPQRGRPYRACPELPASSSSDEHRAGRLMRDGVRARCAEQPRRCMPLVADHRRSAPHSSARRASDLGGIALVDQLPAVDPVTARRLARSSRPRGGARGPLKLDGRLRAFERPRIGPLEGADQHQLGAEAPRDPAAIFDRLGGRGRAVRCPRPPWRSSLDPLRREHPLVREQRVVAGRRGDVVRSAVEELDLTQLPVRPRAFRTVPAWIAFRLVTTEQSPVGARHRHRKRQVLDGGGLGRAVAVRLVRDAHGRARLDLAVVERRRGRSSGARSLIDTATSTSASFGGVLSSPGLTS